MMQTEKVYASLELMCILTEQGQKKVISDKQKLWKFTRKITKDLLQRESGHRNKIWGSRINDEDRKWVFIK